MVTKLQDKMKAVGPERRKKIEARAAELMAEEMALRDLRRAHHLTQEAPLRVIAQRGPEEAVDGVAAAECAVQVRDPHVALGLTPNFWYHAHLEGAGFSVVDLGRDVPAERFVDEAERQQASVIGMSALLTTTMPRMKDVVSLVQGRGLAGRAGALLAAQHVQHDVFGSVLEVGRDALADVGPGD